MIVVAIDIGGTFTDLIGFDQASGRFVQAKSLTTPAQLGQGVIDWKEFFAVAKSSGIKYYYVEMDPATFTDSAKFIRSV